MYDFIAWGTQWIPTSTVVKFIVGGVTACYDVGIVPQEIIKAGISRYLALYNSRIIHCEKHAAWYDLSIPCHENKYRLGFIV
mgnify:CR=1 FL=1